MEKLPLQIQDMREDRNILENVARHGEKVRQEQLRDKEKKNADTELEEALKNL